MGRGKRLRSAWCSLIGILLAVIFVFPIVWCLLCSLVPEQWIEKMVSLLKTSEGVSFLDFLQPLFRWEATLEQYWSVLIATPDYLIRFWNSVFLVVPIVLFQLIVACMAAYGFCCVQGKLKAILFFGYLILMMMPYQVTVIPNYIAMKQLNLTETNWSIWLPGIFAPFSVYLLTKYMRRIPDALFEAARMDGAGERHIFLQLAVPMCRGEIVACGIPVLLIFLSGEDELAAGIASFRGVKE